MGTPSQTGDDQMKKEQLGQGVKFERIRRITGYLVGTLDRWCNAKRQEEKDRVVHKVETKKWIFLKLLDT